MSGHETCLCVWYVCWAGDTGGGRKKKKKKPLWCRFNVTLLLEVNRVPDDVIMAVWTDRMPWGRSDHAHARTLSAAKSTSHFERRPQIPCRVFADPPGRRGGGGIGSSTVHRRHNPPPPRHSAPWLDEYLAAAGRRGKHTGEVREVLLVLLVVVVCCGGAHTGFKTHFLPGPGGFF